VSRMRDSRGSERGFRERRGDDCVDTAVQGEGRRGAHRIRGDGTGVGARAAEREISGNRAGLDRIESKIGKRFGTIPNGRRIDSRGMTRPRKEGWFGDDENRAQLRQAVIGDRSRDDLGTDPGRIARGDRQARLQLPGSGRISTTVSARIFATYSS
jgi:hypothetical protein